MKLIMEVLGEMTLHCVRMLKGKGNHQGRYLHRREQTVMEKQNSVVTCRRVCAAGGGGSTCQNSAWSKPD